MARAVLRDIFDAAVASADPGSAVLRHLPEKPKGRCVVIGAGKASVAMAAALETAWGDVDLTGVVVTCVYRKPKSERSGDEVRPRWRANL